MSESLIAIQPCYNYVSSAMSKKLESRTKLVSKLREVVNVIFTGTGTAQQRRIK